VEVPPDAYFYNPDFHVYKYVTRATAYLIQAYIAPPGDAQVTGCQVVYVANGRLVTHVAPYWGCDGQSCCYVSPFDLRGATPVTIRVVVPGRLVALRLVAETSSGARTVTVLGVGGG